MGLYPGVRGGGGTAGTHGLRMRVSKLQSLNKIYAMTFSRAFE